VFSNVPALAGTNLGNAIIPELTRKNRLPKRAGGVKTTLTGQAGTKIPGKISRYDIGCNGGQGRKKNAGALR